MLLDRARQFRKCFFPLADDHHAKLRMLAQDSFLHERCVDSSLNDRTTPEAAEEARHLNRALERPRDAGNPDEVGSKARDGIAYEREGGSAVNVVEIQDFDDVARFEEGRAEVCES